MKFQIIVMVILAFGCSLVLTGPSVAAAGELGDNFQIFGQLAEAEPAAEDTKAAEPDQKTAKTPPPKPTDQIFGALLEPVKSREGDQKVGLVGKPSDPELDSVVSSGNAP